MDRFCTDWLIVGLPDGYYCIPHPFMIEHITVLPSQASGSQSYGYGDLTNFYILVTGRELVALSALGLIVLVGLLLVDSRTNRKHQQNTG